MVAAGAGGGVSAGGVEEKKCELPKTLEALEHPERSAALLASKAATDRRRVSSAGAAARTCKSADIAVPLTFACVGIGL
jgi:hypothetical protein